MKPKSSTPRCVIVGKGRGRPRVSQEPMASVSTWLPAKTHDQLIKIAHAEDRSVSDVVRQVLILNVLNINVFASSSSR